MSISDNDIQRGWCFSRWIFASAAKSKPIAQNSMFSDNDSLAALCARTFGAEVCLLLTDVEGVYDRPPSEAGAKKLSIFRKESSVTIGEKSSQGKPVACVCDTLLLYLTCIVLLHVIHIYCIYRYN